MNKIKSQITYGSHLPVLTRALIETEGPVLELGGGMASTPILNQFALNGRKVTSFENNPAFYHIIKQFNSEQHQVVFINNWDEIPDGWASVVFIDHAPAERRIIDIERFKDSKVLVVHDFEKKEFYGYNKILPLFKYVNEYQFYDKTTGVLSNYIDVTNWF